MNPQYLGGIKSHKMEKSKPEPLDGFMSTPKDDLIDGLNSVQNTDNTLHIRCKPGSFHFNKKANIMLTPTSPFKASSDKEGMEGMEASDWSSSSSSSIYSDGSESANILQSFKSRISAESFPDGGQATFAPNEQSANMTHNTSNHEDSDSDSRSLPALRMTHFKYRNSGPSLMTLHMFTGEVKGTRAVYVPVYKRNSLGKLLKLVEISNGRWRYIEWGVLQPEEIEGGLKILEKPKSSAFSRPSHPDQRLFGG